MTPGRLRFPVSPAALALVCALLVPSGTAGAQSGSGPLDAAEAAARTGSYDEALHHYAQAVGEGGDAVAARRGRIRALIAVGRYGDAETEARRGLEATGSPELWTPLGEALLRRGRLDEAAEAFERAQAEGAADSLRARLELADLRFRRYRSEASLDVFDGFIDVYNRNRGLSAEVLTDVGRAVRRLGRTDPDLFRDALRAYDEAVAADSSWIEPRVRLGELFLEKYNSREARRTFRDALALNPRHPGALVGLARVRAFDHEPDAAEPAREALETNPNHVPARAFLARLHVEVERYDRAEEEARRALETNPASLEALSVLAAAHYLQDRERAFRRVRERADSLYPASPELALTVAELAARHRRYPEAVRFAREAVDRDRRAWTALGLLGLNQLRTGRLDAGRRDLEAAFEGDPYNVWFKNTLDLLDGWSDFETRRTEHFEILLHRDEADLLGPYVERTAEEAWERVTDRYDHEPPTPIRLEIYPDHADFSVRTVGLTGIGALGVSFGPVVVMDSPSARDPASFNWASALWHEVAHSVHLSLSRHRVPRWFTEGLAVHDQRDAASGWGHGPGVAFLRAFDADRLPPPSRLNDGFARPDFPGQVALSYYQASLVFAFVEEAWGFGAVRRMLDGYARGSGTAELLDRVLEVDPDRFDRRFETWVRERFEEPLRAVRGAASGPGGAEDRRELERRVADRPDDFRARLRLGRLLREAGELEAAARHLEAARGLFPGYAGNDGPLWELARVRETQGRPADAADLLAELRAVNESHLPAALLEARLREEGGDLPGAAAALERALEIAPFEAEVHERLAGVYAGMGRPEDAVAEREAVLALDPLDRAEAEYRLARARIRAGDRQGAREAVLRALERAPRFEKALELLLELREAEVGPGEPAEDSIPGPAGRPPGENHR